MNLFEIATRKAYRFNSVKGLLSVEDLWHLPLSGKNANLDDIAKDLFKKLQTDNVSFVNQTATTSQSDANNMFEIVKHIIAVKIAEQTAAVNDIARRQQREKIQQIIAEKQDDSLKNMSVEELAKLAEQLK